MVRTSIGPARLAGLLSLVLVAFSPSVGNAYDYTTPSAPVFSPSSDVSSNATQSIVRSARDDAARKARTTTPVVGQ
jgi:hypothetical protein